LSISTSHRQRALPFGILSSMLHWGISFTDVGKTDKISYEKWQSGEKGVKCVKHNYDGKFVSKWWRFIIVSQWWSIKLLSIKLCI